MKDWTDDEVRSEIQDALRIFREDHIIRELSSLKESLAGKFSKRSPDNDQRDRDGNPPPVKDPKPPSVKKSLWWGEQEQ